MASADFDAMMEDDSWLQDSPPRIADPVSKPLNKRAKAYNIDEILKEHYKDKNRRLDREAKRFKTFVSDSEDSDDEEFQQKTRKEVQFEKLVETCEKQVHTDGATLEAPRWGERLFCGQRHKEPTMCLKMDSPVVQALVTANRQCSHESIEAGKEEQSAESLVAELLASGWFLLFKIRLKDEMLCWIFHRMVFTNDNTLEKAACDLLCHTLESDSMNYSWIPSYKGLLRIFEAYGYARPQTLNCQASKGSLNSQEHPPHNLGSLLRFLIASMRKRHLHHFYTKEDVEDMAALIASLSLDRSLLFFCVLIKECLESIVNSFTEDEWLLSCERIALCMTKVDRHVVNCLKLTRALHSREDRMKSLQRIVALHFLAKIADEKVVSGVWEMLAVFRKTDVKRTVVDFGTLYYQMCMADIWLWSNEVLGSDKAALGAWLHFLKSCSFQISSTDWRPFATKVRNHASYLLQVYQCYYQGDDYEDT